MIPVITVDGPSGVGKGTLCKILANKLKWNLLNSGVIYRILALLILKHNININIEEACVSIVKKLDIQFKIKSDNVEILLKGKNISQEIYQENIGNIASQIAIFPGIRKILLHYQRTFCITPGLVADGRDMGTIVFPNAIIKVFLNASLETRTYRRMKQLQKHGLDSNFKYLLYNIQKRDQRDCCRALSPLTPAVNAIIIDSTNLTANEVVTRVLVHIKKIFNQHNLYYKI